MKPFPVWYISAINTIAKDLKTTVVYDKESATWNLEGITLTAPGGEGNDEPHNHTNWLVGIVTIIPGRWYMPNGDPGYPDEADWDEDFKGIFPYALKRVAELIVGRRVEGLLEGAEYDYYAQQEEAEHANFPFSGSF